MKRLLFSFAVIFATVHSFAGFRYKTALPEMDRDDFYAIDLPYSVLGKSQADFADIRILDNETQQEIAFAIKENFAKNVKSEFIPFPISVEKQGKSTNVIIETDSVNTSYFRLKIKNADVNKTATLQGSNDRQNWYGVKDKFLLTNNYDRNKPETIIDIDFPMSDYQYYKLTLNDSLSAPLNILAVGLDFLTMTSLSREIQFLQLPIAGQTITTKDKNTEIGLVFDDKFLVSKLELYISNPPYFSRQVQVFLPAQQKIMRNRKRKTEYVYARDFFTTIISSQENERVFTIDYNHRTDTLLLSINNGDDQALTIDSIKAFTKSVYLVAFLQKGKSYSLVYGDSLAVLPCYDLTFADNLPEKMIHIMPLKTVEKTGNPAEKQSSSAFLNFMKTYGLWAIILLMIGQILYMVWRIMKQK